MCHFLSGSLEDFPAAFEPDAPALRGDMPNDTDIEPVIFRAEVVERCGGEREEEKEHRTFRVPGSGWMLMRCFDPRGISLDGKRPEDLPAFEAMAEAVGAWPVGRRYRRVRPRRRLRRGRAGTGVAAGAARAAAGRRAVAAVRTPRGVSCYPGGCEPHASRREARGRRRHAIRRGRDRGAPGTGTARSARRAPRAGGRWDVRLLQEGAGWLDRRPA
ncbi:hypothetical protein OJF2_78000 [Aquisphaera giovannonii]|uniref:Uncharacterized protein n=2 Tax=Aquisphaera giovannonii TaxID=406548 RepID=A0A5B9WEW7_9BACT|nr:hypothetical protein OJF2_78000 [Aquisphaera giovannonii]